MGEKSRLVNALKGCLVARNMTYESLSRSLQLSISTIKRSFAEEAFTLERLEQICEAVDISFYDLAKMARQNEAKPVFLTLDQESILAADEDLFTSFYLLLCGLSINQIANKFAIPEQVVLKHAIALDRIGLIKLLPGNHVRILVSRRVQWRNDGILRKLYEQPMREDFLKSSFADDNEWLFFACSEISEDSMTKIKIQLDKVTQEFDENANHSEGKRDTYGFMIAYRPWSFSPISAFKDKKMSDAIPEQEAGRGS